MESFFNTIDQFDQIIKTQSEEYLTFFTMCMDNLLLNNFSSVLFRDIYEIIDDEDYYDEDYNDKENNEEYNILLESTLMANEDINLLKSDKFDFPDMEIIEYYHLSDFLKK
jgi:hypothetical protein